MFSFIEKKFNIHLRTYIQEGTFLFSSYFISILCTLITSITFAHLLSKNEYGTYKLLLSISAVIGAFTLTGINTAVTRAIAQNTHSVYRTIVRYQLIWNMVVTCGVLIYTLFFTPPEGVSRYVLYFITLATLFLTAFNTYSAYFNGKRNFALLTKASISTTLLQTLTVVIVALTTHSGTGIIIGIFTLQTLTAYYFHHKAKKEDSGITGDTKEIIHYGIKLSAISFFKNIAEQIDKILTFTILGPVALALYSFAYALPDQMRGLYKIIPSLALPHFSAKEEIRVRMQLKKYLLLLFVVALATSMLYALIAPIIFHLLFPTYNESIAYSQVIGITTILLALQIPLTSYLQAYKKTKAIIISNSAQLILDSVAIFFFAGRYGIWGVIYGKMLSALVLVSILYIFTFYSPLSASQEIRN